MTPANPDRGPAVGRPRSNQADDGEGVEAPLQQHAGQRGRRRRQPVGQRRSGQGEQDTEDRKRERATHRPILAAIRWNRPAPAGVRAAMKRTMPGLFVVLLAISACAAPGSSPDPSPTGESPGPDPTGGSGGTGGIEHPGGSEAILILDSAGGFVPVEFLATRLPMFVLLGDGRVIMQGPQTLEFPGPAYPALIERTLTEDGIQTVLRSVEETNLFTSDLDLRGAQSMVADAADTLFILNAGGQDVTVSIYGLGALIPGMEPAPGITSGELEAHRILGLLNDGLMTLDTWLPDGSWEAEGWQPYEPEAFRLYVRDATGDQVDGGDFPEQVRAVAHR